MWEVEAPGDGRGAECATGRFAMSEDDRRDRASLDEVVRHAYKRDLEFRREIMAFLQDEEPAERRRRLEDRSGRPDHETDAGAEGGS